MDRTLDQLAEALALRHALSLLLSHLLSMHEHPNAAVWLLQTQRKVAAAEARVDRLTTSLSYGVRT